ncbi:hypothetical protein RBA41_13520 [Massilia sp. CCM 9210]|uniref:hypothetical protein n=1 Tax=Massilia scottii TaxID=3057166 RepID=UPI002796ADF4|nr:hypothetical protein [Massilia sp. CCM 9210]MDQ1814329.1 hypothetical protein [Massilia sp. CCM 9210]
MRLSALFFAGLCAAAGGAQASSCTFQEIHWARTSASGEILVRASFGTVRSLDHGKTWRDVTGKLADRGDTVAAGGGESFVYTGSDGVQYATRSTNHRRHLVRKAAAGAPWKRLELNYAGTAAPYNAVLVGAQQRTLYFIGGADSQASPVRPSALYRASAGRAEKLVDLDEALAEGARPFFIGDDGSMVYAGPNKLWVSFAAGTGWINIEGQSLTRMPWTLCHKTRM